MLVLAAGLGILVVGVCGIELVCVFDWICVILFLTGGLIGGFGVCLVVCLFLEKFALGVVYCLLVLDLTSVV